MHAEQPDEWAEGRRDRALDSLGRSRLTALPDVPEVTTDPLPALSAMPSEITRQPSHTTASGPTRNRRLPPGGHSVWSLRAV